MKKAIFALSLFFSLLGILRLFIFVFFNFEDLSEFMNFIVFTTSPYGFQGMTIYIPRYSFDRGLDGSTVSMGLLNLFFYLSFLSGTIIYFLSKYKETKLLIFNYSLIVISGINTLAYFIFAFRDSTNTHSLLKISLIGITVFYILLSCFIINKFLNTDNEILSDENLENSSKYKRFFNCIIDGTLILVIAFDILENSERNNSYMIFFKSLKSTFGNKLTLLIFIYIIKVIYYLVFESIFKATPAKFLTGCYVTDEEGNTPTFPMILKRTLYRLIPFESFSFLMDKNLHDDYSDTYVVDKKTDPKIEDRYFQFLAIAFGILLVIYFYMSTKDILFK